MDEARARKLLQAERDRLTDLRRRKASEFDQPLSDSMSELSSFDQHPGDLASETAERETSLAVLEHIDEQLQAIDDAFARLDEGRYGICEGTGEPIPDERLEADPTARYTVEYQRELELEGDTR